jgi:hypothetical protein
VRGISQSITATVATMATAAMAADAMAAAAIADELVIQPRGLVHLFQSKFFSPHRVVYSFF